MKKYLYFLIVFYSLGIISLFAQTISPDKNAVTHSKLRVTTTNEADANDPTKATMNIHYFDGLGRPLQTIGYQQSPTQKDIITGATGYDKYGRPSFSALPTPATTGTGACQSNVIGLGQNFYGDSRPFSSTIYDNSPLNRESQIYGVGQAWQSNDKRTQIFNESAGTDIRIYKLDASNNIILDGNYPTNSLYKKRIIDEQGHTSIKIIDKRGRLVQEQRQDETGFITTYYINDGLGRIRAVIQPEGYELNATINNNSAEWNKWIFFYLHDYRGRVIEKKVPSADLEYFVYDKWDRIVWQQNAQQRQKGFWTFKKYDHFNRLIMAGEKSESRNRVDLQAETVAWTGSRFESRIISGAYYSFSNSYPQIFTTADIRDVFFYDNYNDWLPANMTFDGANAYHNRHPESQSMATGGMVRSTENDIFMPYANYYDNKNRIIQSFAHNLYQKAERTDFKYNFAGEVLETKSLLFDQNNIATVQVERFEYDNAGRRTTYKVAQNATPDEIICNYEYNEIGQLSTKKYFPNQSFVIGGTKDYIIRPNVDGAVTQSNTKDLARKAIILQPTSEIRAITFNTYKAEINPNAPQGQTIQALQTMNFKHHIRGDLLGINLDNAGNSTPNASEGDLFSMKLGYESEGFYDGNIGKQSWQNINPSNNLPLGMRSFSYNYTPNSALKSATYNGIGAENFSMPNLSYDKNGNITNLKRNGRTTPSGGMGAIDNLSYNYNGNRLNYINDAVSGNEDVGDFRNNNTGTNDYEYWNDGSLKVDRNKGISLIEYDSYLQKVMQVNFSNGNWVKFFYGIGGVLIKRTNSLGDIWEYTPKAIYKNGVLYQISQSEGRVLSVAGQWIYEFEYRDHQDNLRVAFKADGNQLVQTQTQEQDPFGLTIQPLSIVGVNSQNFRFQNQEKIEDFGLNLNWFKYRPEDSTYGRMWQVDMLADKYVHNSVYAFSENKVTNHIELDGLEAVKTDPFTKTNLPIVANSDNSNRANTGVMLAKDKRAYNSNEPIKGGFPNGDLGPASQQNASISQGSDFHHTDAEKAGHVGVDIAGVVEGGAGLLKAGKSLAGVANSVDEVVEVIKGAGSINEGVLGKFTEHAFAKGRHADLGLPTETMATNGYNLINQNLSKLANGENTILTNINGIPKTFKAFVNDGNVQSINMYPGVSNRTTQGTIINLGNIKW